MLELGGALADLATANQDDDQCCHAAVILIGRLSHGGNEALANQRLERKDEATLVLEALRASQVEVDLGDR